MFVSSAALTVCDGHTRKRRDRRRVSLRRSAGHSRVPSSCLGRDKRALGTGVLVLVLTARQ